MAKAEKTPLPLAARIKTLLVRDTARQLTPAQLRQQGIRRRSYLRGGIHAFFFLTIPSAFVAG